MFLSSDELAASPPQLRRGGAKRRGGVGQTIDFIEQHYPPLRGCPPQLRRAVSTPANSFTPSMTARAFLTAHNLVRAVVDDHLAVFQHHLWVQHDVKVLDGIARKQDNICLFTR